MKNYEQEYKRVRPLMGSFLSIQLHGIEQDIDPCLDEVISEAFHLAEKLQEIFSVHSSVSNLNEINAASAGETIVVKKELFFLLRLALKLWRSSGASFNPFFGAELPPQMEAFEFQEIENKYLLKKLSLVKIDLSGIAKGYIVDRVVEFLKQQLPQTAGIVNAGGDLKFFNTLKRCTTLRLGSSLNPIVRNVVSAADCVASSSPSISKQVTYSSTRYYLPLRENLTVNHTAVAMSHCCCLADSLTKVALFGTKEAIAACAREFHSQIFIFSPAGALVESYGEV